MRMEILSFSLRFPTKDVYDSKIPIFGSLVYYCVVLIIYINLSSAILFYPHFVPSLEKTFP